MAGINVKYKGETWDLIKDYDLYCSENSDYGVAIKDVDYQPKLLIINMLTSEVVYEFDYDENFDLDKFQWVDFFVVEAMKQAIETYENKVEAQAEYWEAMASQYLD